MLNKTWDARQVIVKDCTPNIDSFKLDIHGFQFVHFDSKEKDFLDDEKIQQVYYPEVAELLKNMTGAYRAHVFNHLVRGISTDEKPVATPSYFVHGDQSYEGALTVLSDEMGEDSEILSKKRFQIVNVSQDSQTNGLKWTEEFRANRNNSCGSPSRPFAKIHFVSQTRDLCQRMISCPSRRLYPVGTWALAGI